MESFDVSFLVLLTYDFVFILFSFDFIHQTTHTNPSPKLLIEKTYLPKLLQAKANDEDTRSE